MRRDQRRPQRRARGEANARERRRVAGVRRYRIVAATHPRRRRRRDVDVLVDGATRGRRRGAGAHW